MNLQGLGAMDGLKMLAQLGPMIQQAMASGNVQISQGEPQVLDMRGSGLREEIIGIMNEHGIDPAAGTANQNIDASAYGEHAAADPRGARQARRQREPGGRQPVRLRADAAGDDGRDGQARHRPVHRPAESRRRAAAAPRQPSSSGGS